MEIQKNIKISISQADVEQAIRELIRKQDSTIVVDKITFTAKRSGDAAIGISVDAHFGTINTPIVRSPEEAIQDPTCVKYEDDHASDLKEPYTEEDKQDVEAPAASNSLFG